MKKTLRETIKELEERVAREAGRYDTEWRARREADKGREEAQQELKNAQYTIAGYEQRRAKDAVAAAIESCQRELVEALPATTRLHRFGSPSGMTMTPNLQEWPDPYDPLRQHPPTTPAVIRATHLQRAVDDLLAAFADLESADQVRR